jgi:hypothetical protein
MLLRDRNWLLLEASSLAPRSIETGFDYKRMMVSELERKARNFLGKLNA